MSWKNPGPYTAEMDAAFAEASDALATKLSKFRDVVPFVPGKRHVPAYYRPARRNPRINPSADVSDVLHAWAVDDHALGEAVAKILRLGRKPGEPRVRELTKVLEHVTRALEYAELEVRDRCEAEARDARSTSVPIDDPLAGYSETVRRAKGGV